MRRGKRNLIFSGPHGNTTDPQLYLFLAQRRAIELVIEPGGLSQLHARKASPQLNLALV